MKKILLTIIVQAIIISSCSKDNTPKNINDPLPTGTVLISGTFTSNVHTTSGAVKVAMSTDGKKYLIFENFKTDNGTDLRVWLSPSTSGTPYQEVGLLKAVTGNFSYELNASINYTANNRVLIWCEDFSVLFGNAALQ
jgi:hypothetical protein